MLAVIFIAVIVIGQGCEAYIIGVGRDATGTRCITCISDVLTKNGSRLRAIASAASIITDPGVSPGHNSTNEVSYMPPPSSTHSTGRSSRLTTPEKAGIIAASVAAFILLLGLVLEYTHLRHKRQDRAVKRADDETDGGTELKGSIIGASKENMVLESRVEIVVEEEQVSVRESVDEEGEWDAGTDGEESDGDLGEWGRGRRLERGRNGMSLPRTES